MEKAPQFPRTYYNILRDDPTEWIFLVGTWICGFALLLHEADGLAERGTVALWSTVGLVLALLGFVTLCPARRRGKTWYAGIVSVLLLVVQASIGKNFGPLVALYYFSAWGLAIRMSFTQVLFTGGLLTGTYMFGAFLNLGPVAIRTNLMELLENIGTLYPAALFAYSLAATRCREEAKTRRLAAINYITTVLNTSLDLDEVYDTFAKELKQLIDFDRASLALFDEDEDEVRAVWLAGESSTLGKGSTLPIEGTAPGWVKTHKRAQIESDFAEEAAFLEDEKLLAAGLRSGIRVPLIIKGEVIGTLNLNSQQPHQYSEADLEVLEPIAGHLALAVEQTRLYRKTRRLAMVDDLTGLYNRRYFFTMLDQELSRSRRYRRRFALLLLDLDDLKRCNDTYGHLAGDELICQAGEILQAASRDSDIVARYGGDEFAALLPETDLERARRYGRRVRETIAERTFQVNDDAQIDGVSISVGVAIYPDDATDAQELVAAADAKLYTEKRTKRAGAGGARVNDE